MTTHLEQLLATYNAGVQRARDAYRAERQAEQGRTRPRDQTGRKRKAQK